MIGSLLLNFASDIHVSLRAEEVFQVGPLRVTNSILYGIFCAIFIGILMVYAGHRIKIRPRGGVAQFFEIVTDFLVGVFEGVFGSRKLAIKYAPIYGSFFFFIVFCNALELLPLVGHGLTINNGHEVVPLFRPFTADLNATIALSVISIIIVQILSIREQGVKKHLIHYFSDKPLNPINFFIGLLEVFGEFTRILSLSLRLFLNVAVGDILIAVFTSLIASNGRTPLAAIPIFLFETLVAGIQAYVFTVLSATYLGLAISHAHEEATEVDHQPANIPAGVDERGMHGG